MLESVNETRKELFCTKTQSLENLPPTQDSLLQHVKRAIYQGNVLTMCQHSQYVVPSLSAWGWTMQDNQWIPMWMSIPEAAKHVQNLLNVYVNLTGVTDVAKCAKIGLSCTELCQCN